MSAQQVGNLWRLSTGVIADRAAREVLVYARPRALTIDPEGRCWVEAVHDAAESDLVGVYGRALGLLELTRRIAADLNHERAQRREPDGKRRVVVGEEARRARRAA